MTNFALKLLMLLCCAAFPNLGAAQSHLLSLPREARVGQLSNGLKYIVMPSQDPPRTVELRLLMKVGSVLEDDYEGGTAHYLEHLAFGGTKNFPERDLIDGFEKIGMKFGRDINAMTGYDRTIYMLTLPVGNNTCGVVERAIMAAADWIDNISLLPERVDRERGIIMEEWRGYDMGDDFYKLKLGNSRFASRIPLGEKEDIMKIDALQLRRFYEKHYDPSRATLIFVGDADPLKVERLIKKVLGHKKSKTLYDSVDNYELTYPAGVSSQITYDRLLNTNRVELIIPHKAISTSTAENTARAAVLSAVANIASQRMKDMIDGTVSDAWYLAETNHFTISLEGGDRDAILRNISRAASVMSRLQQDGPSKEELEAALRNKSYKWTVREDRNTEVWADIFMDMAMSGDRVVCSQEDSARVEEILARDAGPAAGELISEIVEASMKNMAVAQRLKTKSDSVSSKDVSEAWLSGLAKPAPEYHYASLKAKEEHISEIPERFRRRSPLRHNNIVKRCYYKNLKLTELQLSGGVRLLLRPTPDNSRRICIMMLGRGGAKDIPSRDYFKYSDATAYMDMGGVGDISSDSLFNIMSSNEMTMCFGMDAHSHQVVASCKNKDMSSLMQIILAKIYHPQLPYEDFLEVKSDELENFGKETHLDKMMKRDVDRMMQKRLDSLLGDAPCLGMIKKREDVEHMNLDSIASFFTSLYGNPEGLSVIVTGSFDISEAVGKLTPLLVSMRPTGNYQLEHSEPAAIPSSYSEEFHGAAGDQLVEEHIWAGSYEPSLKASLTLKLVRDVLSYRMLTIMREKYNIVYSPYTELSYDGLPEKKFNIRVTISMHNRNVGVAHKVLSDILRGLRAEPVSKEELDGYKRSFNLTRSKNLTDDNTAEWKRVISSCIMNGEDFEDYDVYEDILESITPEEIRKAFEKYFVDEHKILLQKVA